jgi:glycosyltransferase involved in cell wall biosynthesis
MKSDGNLKELSICFQLSHRRASKERRNMDVAPQAVICIPSFRRPEGLRRTLASLLVQKPDFPYAIVVIDNDASKQEALNVAREFFASTGVSGTASVEPRQGNCFAINAAFSTALDRYPSASYFLMIDDDESASPDWLALMVETAKKYEADLVGGSVVRFFDKPAPGAVSRHPVFAAATAETTGLVKIIHGSGNCLITRRVFETLQDPEFDLRFNFLGGGDIEFFTRCKRAGFRFAWCEEAGISEYVPEGRMSSSWLIMRSLRTGVINYSVDRAQTGNLPGRLFLVGKNAGSLGLSVIRAAKVLFRTGHLLPATYPILVSTGRILGSFGLTLNPYKAAK